MNIYVRNLSPKTSQSTLLESFEKHGMVKDVTISTYKVEGRHMASGFVEMPSEEQARAAISALQGQQLDGNILNIQED